MNQTYYDVFETLFSEFPIANDFEEINYRFPLNLPDSGIIRENLREVRNFISSVANESNHKKIRPDAKLFLTSNYCHMVLLPVLLANYNSDRKFPLDSEFKKQVNDDITAIFQQAGKSASNEISSHSILQAINETWGNLFTTVRMSWSDPDKY